MPDPNPARHEIHVALRVTDEAGYQAYRDAMTPLLESMGGRFRFDMRIAELLKGDAPEEINRAFVISFPDKPTRERFFNDPAYRAVRDKHFDASVAATVIIAEYDLARPAQD